MDHNQASLLECEEVAKVLETELKTGLTVAEAQLRLKHYGANRLNELSETESALKRYLWQNLVKFLKQFLNPLIQLLLLCVIISLVIGECENSISIMVAILIVCSISYIQERRADKSLEKLARQMPSNCKVIREGQAYEIEADLLVPGDVVHLSEGQRVPADLRLFELHSLTINEANLTGETQSQLKSSQAIQKELTNLLQSGYSSVMTDGTGDKQFIFQNLALMGTVVESGHSRGLVIATGKSTRYGEVFNMLKSTEQPKSPLQTNIDQLSLHLVVASCFIIGAISILGIVQQRQSLEVIYYAISLAVTAIPEGLPVVVAVIMALGVIRLGHHKTIVKSLASIETLGCIQVLCSDKTGTLTRNDMTLTDIVTSELHSLSSSELEELNNEECMKQMTFNRFGGKMCSLGRVMEAGTLCNNATVDQSHSDRMASEAGASKANDSMSSTSSTEENNNNQPQSKREGGANDKSRQPQVPTSNKKAPSSYRYIGQATECAILDAAIRLGFGDSRTKFERIMEIPFNPTNRRMVVQCRRRDQPGRGPMFYVKGAWEEILRDCQHYYECGLIKPRTDEMWLEYGRVCTALGSQGLRVLALATGPTLDQLTFVGLIGINNQLRDGMVDTICKLRERFHIDVKMITGDSRATAVAVGKQLGLIENNYYSSPFYNNNNNNNLSSHLYTSLSGTIPSINKTSELSLALGQATRFSHAAFEDEDDKFVMSGEQLQKLLNTDMDQALKSREILSRSVFYRVDPIQKANIVSKLQDLNKVVAMTGDGVNDIISLKRANLSLVMGSGADVCKEIADVIIMDDDLSVLLEAVIEGKGIYHKIHTFMAYQMSISLALVLLIAIAFGTRSEPPFTVMQLLLINILADGPPAQALGMEQLSENELCLWPRNVQDPIMSCRLLGTLLVLTLTLSTLNGGLYLFLLNDEGRLDGHARGLLFTCFVFCTIFAALGLKSKFKTIFETRIHANRHLLYCCLAVGLIQVALTQVDGLNSFFQLERLKPLELLYVILYASLVLLIMDGVKVVLRFFSYTRKLMLEVAHKLHNSSVSSDTSTYLKATEFIAGRKPSAPPLPQVVVPSIATIFQQQQQPATMEQKHELKEKLERNF